jgi:hypothetical protein
MLREKKSNLAIFTLAGSILISSVIISMNQANAHSTSATKREFLAFKKCISDFQKESAQFNDWILEDRAEDYATENANPNKKPTPNLYKVYLQEPREYPDNQNALLPEAFLSWIADGLQC